jgi:hypothetical protein
MSLRTRLSDITERAPIGRRLWFATPLRLSLAAAALAVLVLGIVLWPRQDVGPEPSASPGPSSTVEPTPSLEPSVEPTTEPTEIPTVAPTPSPVPTAPPREVWTGLAWSDPVTPSFTVHLYDLLPWGDGYVAVGEAPGRGAASFTSPDGVNWMIEQSDFPGTPRHLVALGDELLAFMPFVPRTSPPGTIVGAPPTSLIWRSTDGATWAVVDSLTWMGSWDEAVAQSVSSSPDGWDDAQHDLTIGLVDVASGPHGLVAIGNAFGADAMTPILLHSTDGETWTSTQLPVGSDSALLNSVVEHDGRFIITGAIDVWADPATATAAAWYSDDGRSWVRATVDADQFSREDGAEFGPLWAGDDGLLTCSGSREMAAGGWRFMTGWVSTDGTTWQYAMSPGPHPGCDWSAADGTRIVSLGPRDHASPMPWPGITAAWTSADGRQSQPVELASTLTDRLERFWVVPDGVIYAGAQSFWFGTATIAP